MIEDIQPNMAEKSMMTDSSNICPPARKPIGGPEMGYLDPWHRSDTHERTQVLLDRGTEVKTLIAILFAIVATAAQAQQTTFRDAGGRTIGTATLDSQGTTVFRDARGRTTGTATLDGSGTTTFRDAGGRTIGRSSR